MPKRRYKWRISPEQVSATRLRGGLVTATLGQAHYERIGRLGGRPPWHVSLQMTGLDKLRWLRDRKEARMAYEEDLERAKAQTPILLEKYAALVTADFLIHGNLNRSAMALEELQHDLYEACSKAEADNPQPGN